MLALVQTLMERVYEFREQSLKAKQELTAQQEENKDLKIRLEQVTFSYSAEAEPFLEFAEVKRAVLRSAKHTLDEN